MTATEKVVKWRDRYHLLSWTTYNQRNTPAFLQAEFLQPRYCSDLQYQDFHKLLLQLVMLLGTNAVPKDGSKEAKKKKSQS